MASLSWQDIRIREHRLSRREFLGALALAIGGAYSLDFNTPSIAEAQTAVAKAPGGAETAAAIPWRASATEKGMRFTQDGKTGYEVTGDVYSQFENYGGQAAWGVPVSREWVDINNRKNQAFERGIFQVTSKGGQISTEWMNVYDELGGLGYNGWLSDFKSTPKPADLPGDAHLNFAPSHHAGGPDAGTKEALRTDFVFEAIPQYPQLKTFYFKNPLWFEQYGLPSAAADLGKVVVVRSQRAAFQLWKDKTDWTDQPMQIVPTTAGTIAREASEYGKTVGLQPLIPLEVLLPIQMDAPVTPESGNVRRFETPKGNHLEIETSVNSPIQADFNPANVREYKDIIDNAAKASGVTDYRLVLLGSGDQWPTKLAAASPNIIVNVGTVTKTNAKNELVIGDAGSKREGNRVMYYLLASPEFNPNDPDYIMGAQYLVGKYFTTTAITGGLYSGSLGGHPDAVIISRENPVIISPRF